MQWGRNYSAEIGAIDTSKPPCYDIGQYDGHPSLGRFCLQGRLVVVVVVVLVLVVVVPERRYSHFQRRAIGPLSHGTTERRRRRADGESMQVIIPNNYEQSIDDAAAAALTAAGGFVSEPYSAISHMPHCIGYDPSDRSIVI